MLRMRQTVFARCPQDLLRDATRAAMTPKNKGAEYTGSMIKIVDHMTGGVANGQKICVP